LASFSADELRLLQDIVGRRDPAAEYLIKSLGKTPLTVDQRERLREILAAEFVDTGLEADDEPNERGRRIDEIIGRLGRF